MRRNDRASGISPGRYDVGSGIGDPEGRSAEEIRSIIHSLSRDRHRIDIEVSPNAGRSEVTGINPWRHRLKVSVKSVPRRGRANSEIMFLFSGLLSLPVGNIRLVRGATSSLKTIEITGCTLSYIEERLREALG